MFNKRNIKTNNLKYKKNKDSMTEKVKAEATGLYCLPFLTFSNFHW